MTELSNKLLWSNSSLTWLRHLFFGLLFCKRRLFFQSRNTIGELMKTCFYRPIEFLHFLPVRDFKIVWDNFSVRMQSFSGLYFPVFRPYSVQVRENADQKNSGYGQFSRSAACWVAHITRCFLRYYSCSYHSSMLYANLVKIQGKLQYSKAP